ncbi:MAG: alanine--tRNA ligase [Candidatus Andersenbacteria bacterium]
MKSITSEQLRERFLQFFESKGHVRIPSAPLVPENDPSVLFTTAGMHPLVPYLKGQPHPAGKRLVDVQKSLRTTDIDEVGDATHATVFEMLGNWSLGDYFKKEAITWSWEFLTSPQWLSLPPERLAVSIFAGDADAPIDEEAQRVWRELGIPDTRIARLGKEDNWWPAGGKHPGPQGPDTEMFYWTGPEPAPETFDPSDKRWVEIWNDVFMQYNRTPEGTYEPLPQQNVDTGMGLERVVMVLGGHQSIYEIDSFIPLMELINKDTQVDDVRQKRILADHIKAFTFVLGDEIPIVPSNTDQGYIVRRLIRRAIVASRHLEMGRRTSEVLLAGMNIVIEQYGSAYPSLRNRHSAAQENLRLEVEKFDATIDRGLRELDRIIKSRQSGDVLSGQEVFSLYETHGLPYEVTAEIAAQGGLSIDESAVKQQFEEAFATHKEKSRTAAAGKFKGGLADHSEQSIKYHTATHLLHQALRTILGPHVLQRGSNITPERLRFDFVHPNKLTAEELKSVEDLVNAQIATDLQVDRQEMTVAEAKAAGALGLFEHKYSDRVTVYSVGDFSREICGGPHVEHTGTLGHFKITKEESASAGTRRIKAILE